MANTILVVDDEPHILQVLTLKLGEAGYEVMNASDGQQALEVVRDAVPDVIITDLQMPKMDGAELCRALRADPATARVPLIILTARGYALGSYDLPDDITIISKPFSPRGIIKVIRQCLGESEHGQSGGGLEAA